MGGGFCTPWFGVFPVVVPFGQCAPSAHRGGSGWGLSELAEAARTEPAIEAAMTATPRVARSLVIE